MLLFKSTDRPTARAGAALKWILFYRDISYNLNKNNVVIQYGNDVHVSVLEKERL